MGYATVSQFRHLTNINGELIEDQTLLRILPLADRLINKLIATAVHMEKLSGDIDGSNTYFYTKNKHVCDTNFTNSLVVDSCDTADFTESTDATADTVAGSLAQEGGSSIAMGKSGGTEAFVTYTKASTERDGTGRRLRLSVHIKNVTELAPGNAMEIRIGSASNAYYTKSFTAEELKNGLNEIDIDLTDMGTSGTPVITALDYILIEFNTPATTTTITHGDLAMDSWRLVVIDTPDTSDAEVYLLFEDSQNEAYHTGPVTITAIRSREGRIELTTAPTADDNATTGAELGVYADYSYVSGVMDWQLIKSAACYMAAHLSSFIIAGNSPNYGAIEEAFARRDFAGAPDEWLRLAYSLLTQAVGETAGGVGFRRVDVNDPMKS